MRRQRQLAESIRQEKARGLRYKKPMMRMLNYDSMLEWLYDAQEKCDELEAHPEGGKLSKEFDAAAQMLPEEAWLR